MNRTFGCLCAVVLAASCALFAQNPPDSSSQQEPPPPPVDQGPPPPPPVPPSPAVQNSPFVEPGPLSRLSLGAGFSTLGINFQVATNLSRHVNVRGMGNVFNYSTSFTSNDIPASASLNLDSGGALVDYYPFRFGFRLSAGVLFVNQNNLSATARLAAGDSFTVNNQTYYSANTNPVTGATPLVGTGGIQLNSTKPGAMISTGFGNHVQRRGHWSFPIELGVAFVGTPRVSAAFSGWACTDAAQTQCGDVNDMNSPVGVAFQDNLNAQISKWNSDLNVLGSYPVVSVGVSYSIHLREGSR